jgi:tRNA (guanine-N7-)-methyltransferase
MEQRRNNLHAHLAAILSPGTAFVWEIGCGHGHFLTAYAQAHPEKMCVGIDITNERIERANRKRDRARLPNLHFVRAEARLFIEVLTDGVKLSDIYLLFPDPWPKQRHHKHRIMQSDFLSAVARRAGEQSRLYFRTDFRPYFEDAHVVLDGHPDWSLAEEPWPFEHETVFQNRVASHYSLIARLRVPKP